MTKLLFVLASPRGTAAKSNQVADADVTAIDDIRFEPTLLTADREGDFAHAKGDPVRLARAHGSV